LLIHPTLENLRQLGLAGMARAFEELTATRAARNSIMLNGLVCCSTARSPIDRTDGSGRGCDTHACATAPPSKMSITAQHAASIVRCSRNWRWAVGSRSSRI